MATTTQPATVATSAPPVGPAAADSTHRTGTASFSRVTAPASISISGTPKADRKLPPGQRIHVLVNNSDGLGHSYGAHLNFLIHRKTFENLFQRKMHFMLWLASYQVSSIVITGQGKVGSENNRDPVEFQLSQRADFFEMLTGLQTTHHRPLINERDEPLCGPLWRNGSADRPWARLHVIFYDANLSHVACYLKFGILQIILAMIAAGRVNPRLILEDPVHAVGPAVDAARHADR